MTRGTAPEMTPDLSQIIDRVTAAFPDVEWQQLQAKWPADDDGVWVVNRPGGRFGDIQIESSSGLCPFVVESVFNNARFVGETPAEVANTVVELLASRDIHQR